MRADIAVIGGSGLYSLLENSVEHEFATPYGAPSDRISVGVVASRRVAFLPRHGRGHRFPPHLIPYRANMWALRKLGVRHVLAPCAVGSLRAEYGPGTFLLPDQVVDRTTSRVGTFVESGAHHASFGDPYCRLGRRIVLETGQDIVDGGTMVVIEGPRFSSRAESQWYATLGGAVINMTGMPEAALARELGLCYTPIAVVTDTDAGVEAGEAVTQEEVFAVFAENIGKMRTLLLDVVAQFPLHESCDCPPALPGLVSKW